MGTIILGIESSCDDTSAAVVADGYMLSNVISSQTVHQAYGGVVPELASRAHQQNIIPVVDQAIKKAGINTNEISAVAFTRGPGLMGSLLVGTSFAKGFALAKNVPLIDVNHLQAHILSNFIKEPEKNSKHPAFPFLTLLVSGGHTQIVLVRDYLDMEIIGTTIDDAAGEAFDKCAKVMGLPYPGGPHIDKLAKQGNPNRFALNKPRIEGYNYSFSGLKTSFLYLIRDELKKNTGFIEENKADLCASLQTTIIDLLFTKLTEAAKRYKVNEVAIAGGVAANSGLRDRTATVGNEKGWNVYIPELRFTTDNAAMIAVTGFYKYLKNEFAGHDAAPFARAPL